MAGKEFVSISDVIAQANKTFKKELAQVGIADLVVKRIPYTSPRLNYSTYGGVPRGRLTMFAGKESSGKTSTALDVIKNAQHLFEQEYLEEVSSLNKEIKALTKIIESKDAAKGKKDQAKKQLPELQERLKYVETVGVKVCVYFDAEGTLDGEWAAKLGVNVDNVVLFRLHTQTAEQFLDQVVAAAKSPQVGLIVVDSLAVLIPQLTHDESLEQKSMGGNAKVITDFVNKIHPVINELDTAVILIQQARDDFKNPYAEFAIPGGNALKLACSLIQTFQKGSFVDEAGEEKKKSYETPKGNIVWARIQKTKICKPDRRVGFYTIDYDYGIDIVSDILPLAVEFGVIKKAGSWFSILNPDTGEILVDVNGEPIKFQGEATMRAFLREDEAAFQFIYEYVNNKVSEKENAPDLTISEELDKAAIAQANGEEIAVPIPRMETAAEELEAEKAIV